MNETDHGAQRRRLLGFGALSAGTAAISLATAKTPAAASPEPVPALTAQTTEGPYYLELATLRSDITEGLPGVPLEVRFVVRDETGAPFRQALVDIWHCDAAGAYSGYAHQGDDRAGDMRGRTFLRGRLATDPAGIAAFRSIYPGWYAGRTTHIHFKVLNGRRAVLTSQFFLPDALSEYLYTELPAYRRARLRDTLNRDDGIALEAGGSVIGAVREEADRYVATLQVVVDRHATPVIDRPPPPGEGPPPGMPPGPPPGALGGPPGRGEPPGPPAARTGAARLRAVVPGWAD